jgi:hypothetical protein
VSQKKKQQSKLVWKQGEDWVQFNPPRHHESYEEWKKLKEKEKKDDDGEI